MEYCQQTQDEQQAQRHQKTFVVGCPLFLGFLFFCLQRCSALQVTQYIQEEVGNAHIRHGDGEKFAHAHTGNGVEEQVLGVADRSQHTAKVCRNGLQYDDGDHLFSQVCPLQQHDGEGNKGDEGHIVGDKHGREEAQHDQCSRQLTHFSCPCQQEVCHAVKYPQLLEAAHDCHQTEQQDQYLKVTIFDISCVGRDDKGRNKGQYPRNTQDGFFFEKSNEFFFIHKHTSVSFS